MSWCTSRERRAGIPLATAVLTCLVAALGTVVVPGPAGAAPGTPSPERLVAPVPATGDQSRSAVASDGTNFLVVWQDERNGTASDIYATRVDPNGRVLDVAAIPVSTGTSVQDDPAVAFTGSGYLVVWEDYRNLSPTQGVDIYGARVTTSGAVLDPAGIPISIAVRSQVDPDVVFDGTRSFVVWSDERTSGVRDVYGARVSGATVLDPSGFAISTAADDQLTPAVSFNGTSYMVVWSDWRRGTPDIYAARVSTDAVVAHPNGFAVSAAAEEEFTPDIAWNGTNYLVVWWGGSSGARAAMLTPTGNIEVPDIQLPSQGFVQRPRVSFAGDTFLVVWIDNRNGLGDVFGARVDHLGDVVETSARWVGRNPSTEAFPAIASGGGQHLVVSDADSTGPDDRDIFAGRVTSAGAVLDRWSRLVSTRPTFQNRAAAAFDGTNNLVAWADDRSGVDSNIVVTRVSPSGSVLDPVGIEMTPYAGSDGFPSVAFGGSVYLVVWKNDPSGIDNANLYGQRIRPNGLPVGDSFVVSGAVRDQSEPEVTFDGKNFVVAWTDLRNGSADIYAARVSTGGTVLDAAGIPVSTATGSQSAPDIASDGTGSLIVWGDARNATNDIYGARIASNGSVLDPTGIGIETDNATQFRPAIAYGGDTYLVTWDENGDIWATRVTPAGAVGDPGGRAVSTAPDTQDSPTIAFNGNFLVAWTDRRTGTDDIYGTRITTDGTVADTAGLPLSPGPTDDIGPALAPTSGGWAVAYDHPHGTGRGIYQRTISSK